MQNRNIYIAIIILVALVAAGFVTFGKTSPSSPGNTSTSTATTTADASSSLEDAVKSGRATVTITKVPAPVKPAPDLSYTLKISPDLSPAAVAAVQTQVQTLTAALKKDPKSFDSWMQLGVIAKIAGDDQRAIQLWQYASYLSPKSPEPLANIGDVYGNYLHDYTKGIEYYKEAVAVAPTNPLWQQYLADMQKSAASQK
jgi:tetratricopeptide (TPR) repeat protein